jgi:hypothetical protein
VSGNDANGTDCLLPDVRYQISWFYKWKYYSIDLELKTDTIGYY